MEVMDGKARPAYIQLVREWQLRLCAIKSTRICQNVGLHVSENLRHLHTYNVAVLNTWEKRQVEHGMN